MARSRRPRLTQLEDRSVPATLSGAVFADINANGVRDAGETGLAAVGLQVDVLNDGVVELNASTDIDGNFSIVGLPDGAHTLHVLPPTGTTAVSAVAQQITFAGGADFSVEPIALQPSGNVSGTVFTDLNNNGVQDLGEPGVVGATVTMDLHSNGNGKADHTTITGADGTYRFNNTPDGGHLITVQPPVNYYSSGANSQQALITTGSQATGINFAIRQASSVSGRVLFQDVSPGRPGIVGVPVQIDLMSDGTVDATMNTDKTGTYQFTNVPNGTHTITVTAPAGTVFNVPANSNRITTIVNGDVKGGVNFGVTMAGSAHGGLFLDLNENGQRDPGERNLSPARVQVDLYNSGQLVEVVAETHADGSFRVNGMPDGTHSLVVTPSVGYASAAPIRSTFTVTNGSAATTPAAAVESLAGSTLTVGHGMTGNISSYTFTPAPNGQLTVVPGRTTNTPSRASARVVSADFNGDGVDDAITASGPGERARVRIYDGATGAEIIAGGVPVFEWTYAGGLNLAAGDFNRDGKADIVASADVGGGPRVQVLDGATLQSGKGLANTGVVADFFGIEDTNFRGGTRISTGDVNGDGVVDLVVAAGQGGGPRVAIFDGRTIGTGGEPEKLVGDFYVFESALRNGANVAVGDVDGDGKADLVAGGGPGGAPRVAVFSATGLLANQGIAAPRVLDFYINGDSQSRNGTRVTAKDLDRDGREDIVATIGGRAYIYTAAGIQMYHQTPGMTGPILAASVVAFGDGAGNVFIG